MNVEHKRERAKRARKNARVFLREEGDESVKRKGRTSANRIMEYGSSSAIGSIVRRAARTTRSEADSWCAHCWYASPEDNGGMAGVTSFVVLYAGLPATSQAAQPCAPDSPARGTSDSQNSSSLSSREVKNAPAKEGGQ